MGYNIVDIIDKSISIAEKERDIYLSMGKKRQDIPSIEVMSKVLAKQKDKMIEYYRELKVQVSGVEIEEIDFYIYDKISFLLNEFSKKIYVPEVSDIKEYLKFSLRLEKDDEAMLIDIKGRFVKNTKDVDTKTYKILTDIISLRKQLISTLEKVVKS